MRRRRSIAGLVSIVVAVLTFAVLVFGCRAPGPVEPSLDLRPLPERIRDPEKVRRIEAAALRLLPVEAWPARPVLRQRVRIEWSGGSESFEAVLQRRPGELALIGLGPMNLVGFRIALLAASGLPGGERLVFENRSGRALPFTPVHMLADVQRVFYPWLVGAGGVAADGGESGCRACDREGEREGLVVSERRGAATLDERRFGIAALPEAGQVRVRYADWRGTPALPFRVELENGWFGYRLTIETLEVLAPDAAATGP